MTATTFRERGYAAIGLSNPKYEGNVGAAMRAAGVYGASLVITAGRRLRAGHADTMKAWRHLPMLRVDDLRDAIPYRCIPVAVDMVEGATPLPAYQHPERAFYVFGAEDQTLGAKTLEWCRDVIYVPTNGCMNLAACVNVVLYDRMAKSGDYPVLDTGGAQATKSGRRDRSLEYGRNGGMLRP